MNSREIKECRAKSSETGEWVYGYPIIVDGIAYIIEKGTGFFSIDHSEEIFATAYCPEIIEETFGEYIGLKDRKGKKIYKGDLLDGFDYPYYSDEEHNYFAEVIWFDDSPAFGLYTHKYPNAKVKGISAGMADYIEDFDPTKWEVFGNIYDNSDLIEDDNE